MTNKHRKPAAFKIDDGEEQPAEAPDRKRATAKRREPVALAEGIDFTESKDDPFLGEPLETDSDTALADALTPPVAASKRRGLSLGKIAIAALGMLFSLAFALWVDNLISAYFARSLWLGWTATALTVIAVAALAGLVVREIAALIRLDAVHTIRSAAEDARKEKNPAKARAVQTKLVNILSRRPETARARKQLKELEGEIIDGPHLMELAETELLGPLDSEARKLIVNASKRVSVVTALSPRALLDIGYVLFEAMRLIRNLAALYGGRPGTLGAMRLARDVVGHLAVTGSMAIGDGVIQQLMGHGLASKLSARLGEGVINGLMTARIGIAAMDLCRPMPFHNLKRPGIGEFVGDLTRQATGTQKSKQK
ncbi:YcjF family protein [Hoeflea sp. TYP-13]|uniref:YcjF family protein n=1 Tax=Hoeflea sp. TYP-13 TaxID=3230023 RepID=UPI0034C6653D